MGEGGGAFVHQLSPCASPLRELGLAKRKKILEPGAEQEVWSSREIHKIKRLLRHTECKMIKLKLLYT